jgi:hypothetical protein
MLAPHGACSPRGARNAAPAEEGLGELIVPGRPAQRPRAAAPGTSPRAFRGADVRVRPRSLVSPPLARCRTGTRLPGRSLSESWSAGRTSVREPWLPDVSPSHHPPLHGRPPDALGAGPRRPRRPSGHSPLWPVTRSWTPRERREPRPSLHASCPSVLLPIPSGSHHASGASSRSSSVHRRRWVMRRPYEGALQRRSKPGPGRLR